MAALMLLTGFATALWLRKQGVQWSPESLRDWIAGQPLAPLVFLCVLVLRPFLLLPSGLLMTAAGALFGIVSGTLLGTLGGAISGLMMFWFARSLGRQLAEARFGARLQAIDAYLHRRGPMLVSLYTAFPATPLAFAQLACGLSGLRAPTFLAATLIGMLPRTALLAWLGDSLAQARWMQVGVAAALLLLAVAVGWAIKRREGPVSRHPSY
jgi:uncharacterized membrane protein YdjX (TVP38/TMEM64 family)